ncbi:MAG: HEAT repeat domain-containing protein [Syntrophaceae bacterium]|nr:HEAT repeat domain-containing protein [Syntrophaceae bacterium]
MQKDIRKEELLSPEIQEVLRSVVLAIRAVKLYPVNNPSYFNSVKKSFSALNNYLQKNDEYRIGVHKKYIMFQNVPFEKNQDINQPIAQDLFLKGIREIIFISGLTESELLEFYQGLTQTAEDLEMRGGINSILWEKDILNIKVTETGIDEVITTQSTRRWEEKGADKKDYEQSEDEKKELGAPQRTLVLFDLTEDPFKFGEKMLELAQQTKTENETLEDRLFALYKEAGKKIDEEQPAQRETLYEGLAKSVLALDPRYRNGFIADKLYGALDSEIAREEVPLADQSIPGLNQEVQSGRFSEAWTVQQIATLLKKAAAQEPEAQGAQSHLAYLQAQPINEELIALAQEFTKYSPEEMEEIKAVNEAGTEWDTVRAASRILISLIPHAKEESQSNKQDKDATLFSAIITQLENMLDYLLRKQDYNYATLIVHALQMPMEPEFRHKVNDALKKASARLVILDAIKEVRRHVTDSSEYRAIFSYLSAFEAESTETILKLLAEEKDRKVRMFYLGLSKELSKNQTSLLGRHLSDNRWYFVRNIVNILGESKPDQAITYFRKAAEHKDIRIRQEIINGLQSIGGKNAMAFLARFLSDEDQEVQKSAIRAFSRFPGVSADDATYLTNFLDNRPLKKKEQELTLVAIGVLGNIGGRNTKEYLNRFTKVRWWKSKKLQEERRAAALKAIEEISWRIGDGRKSA